MSSNRHEPVRISVVICNYNYARYVAKAIDSVLNQNYAAHQIIVVDDGSTDDSRQVLAKYDDLVTLAFQTNGGQLAAYNAGFSRCNGDLIIFLDADDMLAPGALERIAMSFCDGVARLHWHLRIVNSDSVAQAQVIPAVLDQGDLSRRLTNDGVLHNAAPGSGNAYSRIVLDRLMPLPVEGDDKVGADFFTIYGSSLLGRVTAIEDCCGFYRVHQCAENTAELMFGNSAKNGDEAMRVQARGALFRRWIAERLGPSVQLAPVFFDFSMEKTVFASSVLKADKYAKRILEGLSRLDRFWQAVGSRTDFGVGKRVFLLLWAAFVTVAPRPMALYAARWLCNPGSRPRMPIWGKS